MVGVISAYCTDFSCSFSSKLIGDVWPMPELRRLGLYQVLIHVIMAKRAFVFVFQVRRAMSSHSKLAKKLSAMALSYASPVVPCAHSHFLAPVVKGNADVLAALVRMVHHGLRLAGQ